MYSALKEFFSPLISFVGIPLRWDLLMASMDRRNTCIKRCSNSISVHVSAEKCDDCHINSLQQSYCPERNQILVWLNFSLQTLPAGIAVCESSPQGFKYVF